MPAAPLRFGLRPDGLEDVRLHPQEGGRGAQGVVMAEDLVLKLPNKAVS